VSPDAPAPGTPTTALFVAGNADERYTTLAVENLLADLAATGNSPLAVYLGCAPFSSAPVRGGSRDRLERYFERYGAAKIPAIRFDELARALTDTRRKKLFATEGSRYSHVLISAPSIPRTGLPVAADAAVLLATRGTSTPGWVYETARCLSRNGQALPIALVILNAGHLEEAAVFFHEVQEEVATLLKTPQSIGFAGYLRFDPDYTDAAVKARRPILEQFPGCPLHGQVHYILRALSRLVPTPPGEAYFGRLAAWLAARSAGPGAR
jgi:hypothetical protein